MPTNHRDTMHTRLAPSNEPREIWAPHRPHIVSTSERRIRAIANTPTLDRWGTIIRPEGMRIVPNSPVPLLYGHREPAGRIIEIERTAGAIIFEAIVADDRAWNLVRTEQVTGISIGFIPEAWDFDDDDTPVCRDWSLCEVSIVSVPANPEARITEVRSFTQTPEDHMPPFHPPARQEPRPADPTAAAPRLVASIPAAAPAVHTMRAKPFDVGRVWQSMVENRELDGLEGEVTRELEKRSDVPTRGKRLPAALFKRAISTDPASIGALSPTQYLGQLLDDVAAVRKWGSLLPRLGFVSINTTRESVAIPKRDKRIVASWGPKDTEAVESDWTAKDDLVSPTYIKTTATIERSALRYGDPAALMLTLQDIGDAMDDGADTGLLYGTGLNDQPVGLLTNPIALDQAGGSVDSQLLMDFKNSFLTTWKADQADASTRWLMNPRSYDALRITSKKQGGAEEWPTGIATFDAGEGVLFGIGVIQSGKVAMKPTANCYDISLIYGRMGVVCWFGGGSVDTIVDAMSLSTRGAVRISAFLDCNAKVRDPNIVYALTNVLARPPAAGAPLAA